MHLVMSLSPVELVKEGLCLTKDLQPAVMKNILINCYIDKYRGCHMSVEYDERQRNCIESQCPSCPGCPYPRTYFDLFPISSSHRTR